MPFTFAHPLYAIPIRSIKPAYFSLTGLILGSMAPDFEYFIALEPHQRIGHTHAGLWLEALPLSLLIALLFHRIIRMPLVCHLPSLYRIDSRAYELLRPWSLNSLIKWVIFVISVTIGFYSHLFVDHFTHQSGFFVGQFPVLLHPVAGIPLYKIAQHSLSLIGLLGQALLLVSLLRRVQPSTGKLPATSGRQKLLFWSVAALIALLTVSLKLLLTESTNTVGILVVAPLSGGMLGILGASLLWTISGRLSGKN